MKRFLNLRTLTIAGAVFAGALTIFLLTRYLSVRETEISRRLAREGITSLVVAKAEIATSHSITAEDLEKKSWPKGAVPEGAFYNVKELEGRVAAQKILAGEPVLEGHLASEGTAAGLAGIIPKGKRAVAVKVNEIIGVAGFIKPGDLVDVIITTTPDEKTGLITKIVLQRVPILAVGSTITREGDGDKAKARRVTAATLLVSPADAEKLALASRSDIQLAMRNTLDDKKVFTRGSTPVRLIGLRADRTRTASGFSPKGTGFKSKTAGRFVPKLTVEIIRGTVRSVEEL